MLLSKKLSAPLKMQMYNKIKWSHLLRNHSTRKLKVWFEGTYYVISDKLFINSFPIQLLVTGQLSKYLFICLNV